MKRIINGFEVDLAGERVFAEQQTVPNYGYLFEVSADWKRIVRCAHISAIGGDSDNPDGDAQLLEKDGQKRRLGDLRSRLCDLAFWLLERRARPTI
jgi:hypothetical protein